MIGDRRDKETEQRAEGPQWDQAQTAPLYIVKVVGMVETQPVKLRVRQPKGDELA